jgi:hypothetical protein
MTGVAAQWCGTAPDVYRRSLEKGWKADGLGKPDWGARRVVLGDLGPAATFIAANYNTPFDVQAFAKAAQSILDDVESELGWMYETRHTDGKTVGRVNYTVWSEVFSCPECSGEVNFVEEALDQETKRVHDEFPCPSCGALLTKKKLDRLYESRFDAGIGETVKAPKRKPVLINYSVGKAKFEKAPDDADLAVIAMVASLKLPVEVPTTAFPMDDMWEAPRLAGHGVTHIHHMFLPRAAQALAAIWRLANAEQNARTRNMLLFFVEQAIWGMSVLARYAPTHFSQVNQYLNGVYYVGSQIVEVSPSYILDGKLDRLAKAFTPMPTAAQTSIVTTGDCASIPIMANSVDYVFTDPPFGDNYPYSELNFSIEAWYRVLTHREPEAVIERSKKNSASQKGISDYQELMRRCFDEYQRVLKPGRWMTVVFSNSRNVVWRAIQEAMGTAGFVVADVRTLDKKQLSFKQVTSAAVKQDLVISAYKPTEALTERFRLGSATPESTWAFVSEHLRHVPVFVGSNGQAEVVIERTAQMLHDRVVAFHVQRALAIPLSTGEFLTGLMQQYPERDGMYFLSDQVAEYDRKRTAITELKQLSLFVNDEASAIQWVRQQLTGKPQTFQDLQPAFMRELQGWARHEVTVELKVILEQCFFRYDGRGPVPSQIHSYLSTNFKDMRSRKKDDPALVDKARDRWYVPDPSKQADLERLREKSLLKEFTQYLESKQRKLKQFRTEAVRAGFKAAYDSGDYKTIVTAAAKLPDNVLQEDEKLLMYFDVASMRLGEE